MAEHRPVSGDKDVPLGEHVTHEMPDVGDSILVPLVIRVRPWEYQIK